MTAESQSVEQKTMKRWAFLLRLNPGVGEEYDKAHAAVWPEMLELLKSAGIHEYSIFRRDELLFLTFKAVDFEGSWKRLENHPVNLRWQQYMAPNFAPLEGLRPGERFPMMEEVFWMP
jgi:L-rhamnose mutarotase